MQPYRVSQIATGNRYHVLAASPEEAIRRVRQRLDIKKRIDTLKATTDFPVSGLTEGVVLDRTGRPLRMLGA